MSGRIMRGKPLTPAAKPMAAPAAAPMAAPAAKPMAAGDMAAKPRSEKQMAQDEKMKACNTKAEGKTGDDKKKFMSSCLSAKPAKAESKMALCNKQTAGMTADARKKAQSECMKGPAK